MKLENFNVLPKDVVAFKAPNGWLAGNYVFKKNLELVRGRTLLSSTGKYNEAQTKDFLSRLGYSIFPLSDPLFFCLI
jgi:hypothetical protein